MAYVVKQPGFIDHLCGRTFELDANHVVSQDPPFTLAYWFPLGYFYLRILQRSQTPRPQPFPGKASNAFAERE